MNTNKEKISVTKCEVCGQGIDTSVLNLGLHPMCDDLVEVGSNRVCKEFQIEILYCENCYTAHQKFQVPKNELFPKTYHYRSRFTSDVLLGMQNLVESCEESFGSLVDKKILDIGCNDGSLLTFFKEKGALTFGIEPTNAYLDAIEKKHTVINDFLTIDSALKFVAKYGKCDLVTFTNVFAHIEDLEEVIAALKILLHQESKLIIENHYLGSILKGNQFDTFYHEHPRTYSYKSFEFIAKSLGLNLLGAHFTSRYGGNIRVYIGLDNNIKSFSPLSEEIIKEEALFGEKLRQMQDAVDHWVIKKKKEIKELISIHGKLRAKAFPGRAAIIVKLLGLSENEIECVFEKPGSMKIDHYLPGTRIPIFSDEKLFSDLDNLSPIINFAWHIPKEIKTYLQTNGIKAQVIDIITDTDFR